MTTAFFTTDYAGLLAAMQKPIKYRCPTCRKWYQTLAGMGTFSCCVDHGPKECCHAFEEQVHKKGWHKK